MNSFLRSICTCRMDNCSRMGIKPVLAAIAVAIFFCHLVKAEDCVDSQQYQQHCDGWEKLDYCKRGSSFFAFMSKNCKKSCGFCDPARAFCVDKSTHCRGWKQDGYCASTSSYAEYMRTNCGATCGFCGGRVTTTRPTDPPTTRPTDPPTTRPAVTAKACVDTAKYQQHCSGWKSNGFCSPRSQWNKFMKDHCRKTCGFCTDIDCGLLGTPGGRIIGGKNAVPNNWKWQVALQDSGIFFCGGSLIHPRWILTAAHCTNGKETFIDSLEVVLGDHDRTKDEGNEVTIPVEKIINHAQYDQATIKHDIALVKLKSDAPLNSAIGLVCLPKKGVQVAVGKNCYVTGWGKVKHPGWSAPILQQAKMPIVDKKSCAELNSNPGPDITDQMVCGGYGAKSVISGCHGDSGGPLVCENDNFRFVLEGAVSWGSRSCDTKDKYTVFTRISEYIDWIEEQMKNN